MLFVFVVVKQPAAAVGALLCTWALDQWARTQDQYFVQNQGMTNWYTTGLLLAAIILRFFKGKPIFAPLTREYVISFLLYGLAISSAIWSIRPDKTVEQFGGMYRIIIVFAFLMPLVISDLKDVKVAFYALISIGFTISLLVLTTGKFEGRNLMFQTGNVLLEKSLQTGNPLAIASMAAYVAVLAMLMNFRGKARIWAIARYAITAAAFAVSVKSGSRGQSVSVLFVVLCFLPYSRRFKDLQSFGALAVALSVFGSITLLLLSSLTKQEAVGHVYADRWSWDAFVGEYSASRVGTSMMLLSAWAQAGPLAWVIGLGSSASFDERICGFYPHVVFAEVLGELGLVGWIILWLFPIFLFQNLRELWHYVKDDPEERGLVAGLGGLALFEIIMSFKQGSLLGSGICMAFITLTGRVTVYCRRRAAEYEQLDAGMYPMTDDDWGDDYEEYPQAMGGAVMART